MFGEFSSSIFTFTYAMPYLLEGAIFPIPHKNLWLKTLTLDYSLFLERGTHNLRFLNISCLANYVQKRISIQQFLKSEKHKKYQKFYFRFNRFWRECFEFEMLSPKTVKPEMKFLLLFVVFILHELL